MWRYAAGQATGSSHEKLGKPCQDRFGCVTASDETAFIAAVADGAGTAAHAHVGAEIAVAAMRDVAALGVRAGRTDYKDLLREGAALARQRLIEAAADRDLAPRDMACTLLAVVLSPLGGAALQIGDGVIVTNGSSSDWNWVFWPQKGEYANSTWFLSDERALAQAEVADLGDEVVDVAMMTDGLEALALNFAARKAHPPFFRTAFAPLHGWDSRGEAAPLSQALCNMLGSAAVRARTEDDASLVLATRRPFGAG
jgi:3-deoxy-D-manno-octulosonate 8-phosphate phosphatase KdsC-like HAD superfamily phosphatase